MILILTNSTDATADYLLPILEDAGLRVVRLDTDILVGKVTASFSDFRTRLTFQGKKLFPEEVHHLWYRRPERLRFDGIAESPESRFALNEWSEAIEGFLAHIPRQRWMNHPTANVAASNKIEQLATARQLGFNVPETILTQDASVVRAFAVQCGGKVIAKPLSNGYIERPSGDDSLIYTNIVTEDIIVADDSEFSTCPTLFQELIRKDRDVRITVVDKEVHAVELRASNDNGEQRCDIRRNNMEDVSYRSVELPSEIVLCIRRLVERYGLRFAAIDMAVDVDGNWVFFEVNPNGQWAWLDISAGMTIADSFIEAFSNA